MATTLVADGDPLVRDYLLVLLASKGHRLLRATEGAEALELVRTEQPDLIISDALVRRMDGYEFVRQLRRDPANAATPRGCLYGVLPPTRGPGPIGKNG